MSERARRIGEIAAATGMTVRTLHYYEEIGLIEPTERTGAGHRLYGPAALEQLYRIAELRRLGLPLDGIRAALERRDDIVEVLRSHLADLDEQLATTHRLHGRLLRLLAEASNDDSTAGADLLDVLEDMTMLQTNLNRRISILVYRDIEAA
ncbi:MAG: MerR family transcriptional regulator, partial [Ilumatobacter sp.]|nr:MerR family transcriptional regulator [Ilumatobacter sp.]